ncbi:transcriptional regulator, GntR family [Pseudorhodobacter antarcticus]|uniref:Transcriptional regulator, GntR family n=1 Tax=Pseudorhodobacter antarcticus TaxID=1077947 RepID=A0A1H8GWM5_9RHOB|nr:GntR family transcriptional regulator [Pseudorhodobacter antarcticus]SEN48265.1 transcriptional regulator, GntR family [Pseudorhodobacter antarcticus]
MGNTHILMMGDAPNQAAPKPLPKLARATQPSVADQVFDLLQHRILTLDLPPGTKLSEGEVAGQMGVSRQPVREAFKRLAAQGFLLIRPQRSTTVSLISEAAVLRARFIRTALETHTFRLACTTLTSADIAALRALIDAQKTAITAQDRALFHALDDQFHREVCIRSGVGYAWDLIHDSKAHMDRIRMLSLNSQSQQHALREHIAILDAIEQGNPDAAARAMDSHLSRITTLIAEVKAVNHGWFTDAADLG